MESTLTWGGAEFDQADWPNVYAAIEVLDAARAKQEGGMFSAEARTEARDGDSND